MLRKQLKLRRRHPWKHPQPHKRPLPLPLPSTLRRHHTNTRPAVRAETSGNRIAGTGIRVRERFVVVLRVGHGDVGGGQAQDVGGGGAGEFAAVGAVAGVAVGFCEEVFLG